MADLVRHVGEVLDAVGAETEQRLAKDDLRKVMVSLVFAYWAKRTGHERTLLDPKRETRLLARLRENGDNVHELLYAVDGYSKDGTLQRLKEERGQAYDGIQTLFRDREMVERLAHHCPGWREGLPHPMAVKYLGQQGQNGPGPSGMAPRADEGVSAAPLSLPGRDRQAQGRQDANGSDTNGGGDG